MTLLFLPGATLAQEHPYLRRAEAEIRRHIEADSLGYLSHEGLLKAVGDPVGNGFCTACFSSRYPVAVSQPEEWQLQLFGSHKPS